MSENSSMSNLQEIDKNELYKLFTTRVNWQDKLYKSAAHKSLDIPEDDMNITSNSGNVTNNYSPPVKSGLGTLGKLAAGAALLSTGMGAGIGIPLILDALKDKNTTITKPIQDIDKTLDIEFEIKNGKIVPLKIKPVEGD